MAMAPFPPRLLEGYRTFASQRLPTEQSRYRELSERGQAPEVMVIGCCDSRVSPEVIFDAGPGELFVMRNIANLVPVYQPDANAHGVSAALEYAVSVLRVKHIVVLGHAQCGGIRAFIDKIEPLSPGDFIGKWMAMFIKPGEKVEQRDHETMQDFTTRIEKAAVFRSLENLQTFPFVKARVEPATLHCMAPISASPRARSSCSIRPPRNSVASGKAGKPCRVGKANGSRECAPDDRLRVPSNDHPERKMVGTAQGRLCPPYRRLRRFLFGADQLAVDQAFRDLDRVQRGALAQIVRHAP